jgi:hypothetical protein
MRITHPNRRVIQRKMKIGVPTIGGSLSRNAATKPIRVSLRIKFETTRQRSAASQPNPIVSRI